MSDYPLLPLLSPSHSPWSFSFSNSSSSTFMSHFIFIGWGCHPMSSVRVIYKRMDVRLFTRDKLLSELHHWRKCLNSPFPATIKYLNSWVAGNPISPSPFKNRFFLILIYFFLILGVCCTMGKCMPRCSCRSQKTTLCTQLSFFGLT